MATTLATEKQSEAIKQRMAEIRTELPYAADDARLRVRQLTDWKYHATKRPLPILAVAAIVGYLIVPSKKSADRVVVEQTAGPRQAAAPAKKGLVAGLVGTVATLALKQATSVAASQLTSLLAQREKP